MDNLNEKRADVIKEIKSNLTKIDKNVSEILLELQWDRKQLLEHPETVTCTYNKNHIIPISARDAHESQCLLSTHGYLREDGMLPDQYESSSSVKLSKHQIQAIINEAARFDTQFKRGSPSSDLLEPLTLERLQSTYTTDERRAIHDAVVAAAPRQELDLTDLPLPSSGSNQAAKSREQVLAKLRDMKRRRVRYRGASRAGHTLALRELIATQMELYMGAKKGTPHDESNTHPSNVIKQEPAGDTINKLTPEQSTEEVTTKYDRGIDRNILYTRDRSRSRSRERNYFRIDRYQDRRHDVQRQVGPRSSSRTKDIKPEDRNRSVSRRPTDRTKEDRRSQNRKLSRDRSYDKNDTRRRDYKEKYSTDRIKYSSSNEMHTSDGDYDKRKCRDEKFSKSRDCSKEENFKEEKTSRHNRSKDLEQRINRYYKI